MMFPDTKFQYRLNKMKCEQMIQNAKNVRLQQQFTHTSPIYAPLLAKVGKQLEALGNNLQSRYGQPHLTQTQNVSQST